jgi:hypothetical protein
MFKHFQQHTRREHNHVNEVVEIKNDLGLLVLGPPVLTYDPSSTSTPPLRQPKPQLNHNPNSNPSGYQGWS